MTTPLRLLVIADVGGEENRHIGDEAMLEANLDGFRRLIPEVAFTVVSRDPAWTAARYGVDSIAPFEFPRDGSAGAEREAMLNRLLGDAGRFVGANPAPSVTLEATIRAVVRMDGLVVSGGGNLSSTWPDLLYQRVALLHFARIFGKPAVILGQTIGPRLEVDERRLLAETLPSAHLIGLREHPSAALALELGVLPERIWYQSDDALFLDRPPESMQISAASNAPGIAVTIDPQIRAFGGALFGSLVSQLGELSQATDAPLILIPHSFGGESANLPSDLTEARVLAEQLGRSNTVIVAGLDARQARQVTGDAEMVISSRYHPIVFGLAAAIPSIGIYGDEYCRIKLQGALAHAGLERWALTYDAVARGELLGKALELWRLRRQLGHELESRHEEWREESRQRWAAVLRALDPAEAVLPVGTSTLFGHPVEEAVTPIGSVLELRRQSREGAEVSIGISDARRCDESHGYAFASQPELAPRRTLKHYLSSLLRRLGLRK